MALTMRERVAAYDDRVRHGRVLVPIEVDPRQLRGLERLGLVERGDRDKVAIARAVTRYLDSAWHLANVGDAIWPADEEDEAA
jgi:hypothetical protein